MLKIVETPICVFTTLNSVIQTMFSSAAYRN